MLHRPRRPRAPHRLRRQRPSRPSSPRPTTAVTQYGYDYDSARREVYVKIVHPGGTRVEERWYDLRANLRRHDVNGRTLLALTADGRTRIRTDENGAQVRDTLDEWDNVVRRVNPDGTEQRFEYEPALRQPGAGDRRARRGHRQYDYDERGNLIRTTEAAGLSRSARHRVQRGRLRQRRRRRAAWPMRSTLESLFEYAYDEQGNLTRLTDPEGAITTYAHNALGQVDRSHRRRAARAGPAPTMPPGSSPPTADPLGNTDRYAYDHVGNLVSHTNPRAAVTRFEYDALDRLTRSDRRPGPCREPDLQRGRPGDRGGGPRSPARSASSTTRWGACCGTATRPATPPCWSTPIPAAGEPAAFGPTRIVYPTFENQLRYDKRSRVVLDTDVDGDEGFVAPLPLRHARPGRRGHRPGRAHHLLRVRRAWAADQGHRPPGLRHRLCLRQPRQPDRGDRPAGRRLPHGLRPRQSADSKSAAPTGEASRYAYDATGNLLEVTQAGGGRIAYAYDAAGRLTDAQHFAAGAGAERSRPPPSATTRSPTSPPGAMA